MQANVYHPTDRPNFYYLVTDKGTIWYSYRTPIAFETPATGLVVRENDWSSTTGKHLNYICEDKSHRIPGDEFERRLAAI